MTAPRAPFIYLDNASTTWPKPPEVAQALAESVTSCSASPGRGGYAAARSNAARIERLRTRLAALLNTPHPERIILTGSATDALNTALFGALAHTTSAVHVVTTSLEHNSVARPLHALEAQGRIRLTIVPCDPSGVLDPSRLLAAVTPETAMVVMIHASNAFGTRQPVEAVGAGLRARAPRALFMIDAAPSIGALPVDAALTHADIIAFSGHKALMGPAGVGVLFVGPRAYGPESASVITPVRPWRLGGTGNRAESPDQPTELPYAFESGTHNLSGLLGLLAALEAVPDHALLLAHKRSLARRLVERLAAHPSIRFFAPEHHLHELGTGVVALTIDGHTPAEVAAILDGTFNIAVRAGLNCAPGAHAAMGSLPAGGAVRVSPGAYTTVDEIDTTIAALGQIAE